MAGTAARTRAVFLLVLAAVTLLAHLSLRRGEYVQDDHLAVEKNPIVARGDLGEIFGTSYWAGAEGDDGSLYRPVTILSYALERRLSGEAVARFSRAINVSLHVLAAAVLVLLCRRIGASPGVAWSAGLLFAVHPARCEAVAAVVGRAEILAALFSWLAVWLFTWTGATDGRLPGAARRRAAAWATAACLFLAMGAKEGALMLPLLLIAHELLFRQRESDPSSPWSWWIDRAAALAPAGLAFVVYLIFRVDALEMFVSLQTPHEMDNPLVRLDGLDRAVAALGLLGRYVLLLVYPMKLSADYSGGVIPLAWPDVGPWAFSGVLIALAIVATTAPTLVRCAISGPTTVSGGRRRVVFALLLFVAPYMVIGNLFFDIGTIFAERLLYMPAAGFCLLLALGIGAGASARVRGGARSGGLLAMLIVFFLCAAFALRTWSRCLDWENDERLFVAVTNTHPDSPRAHYIVGKLKANRGDTVGALSLYSRTTDLYPPHVAAWHETGIALAAQRRYEQAVTAFERTVRLSPKYASAHYNLAAAQRRRGDPQAALRSLRKAVLWDPQRPNFWVELGNIHLQQREFAAAADSYRRAIALGRTDIDERLRLADSGAAQEAGR